MSSNESTSDMEDDTSEDFLWECPLDMNDGSILNLFGDILARLDEGTADAVGWACSDIEFAMQIHDISLSMRHWKSSIHWLAADLHGLQLTQMEEQSQHEEQASAAKAKPHVRQSEDMVIDWLIILLKSREHPLPTTILSHLGSISRSVVRVEESCVRRKDDEKSYVNDLLASVECLEAQLTPMEAFVEVQKKEIESQQAVIVESVVQKRKAERQQVATGESDVLLSAAIKTLAVSSTDTSLEKQNEQGSLIPSHVASKDSFATHVKDENKGIVARKYTSPKKATRYDERASGTPKPAIQGERRFVWMKNATEKQKELQQGITPSNPLLIAPQPAYAKIHRNYLDIETLHYYGIPYEYDADPSYVIVLREMSQRETDVLFEHTRSLRSAVQVQKEESTAQPEPSLTPQWIWSDPHQMYYYATYDSHGNPLYHWHNQPGRDATSPRADRSDSGTYMEPPKGRLRYDSAQNYDPERLVENTSSKPHERSDSHHSYNMVPNATGYLPPSAQHGQRYTPAYQQGPGYQYPQSYQSSPQQYYDQQLRAPQSISPYNASYDPYPSYAQRPTQQTEEEPTEETSETPQKRTDSHQNRGK